MSLLNLWLGPEHVDVYVDTLSGETAARPGEQPRTLSRGETSKLFLLADSNVVIAGNGLQNFLGLLLYGVIGRYGNGFDGLVAELPALLDRALSMTRQHVQAAGFSAVSADEQAIAIGGWSEQLGRMAAMLWLHGPEAGIWEGFSLEPGQRWVSPWLDAWGEEPAGPMPVAEAAEIAARQVGQVCQEAPDVPIGGRLLRAHVTRDDARVGLVCRL